MPFFGGGPNYTNITRHSIDKLHHAIKSNPQGNMFTLYKVKLAKKNVGCLANALNNYPHITQLDVVYSITLTDTSLMEVSSKCDYITSLDFMHCALMASHVLALCDAIRLRPKIRSLKLSKTRLCTLAIRHLSDLVETSKTLEELSITCETLNRTAVCALALALSNNTSLTSLVLKKDNIGAEDSLFIARALCVNTTLQSIDLSTNNISGECVGIISRGNVTLKTLILNEIQCYPDDLERIASGIEANASLTHLQLMSIPLHEKSGRFIQALARNSTLTDLVFHPRSMGDVIAMLRTNRTLQRVTVDDGVWNSCKPPDREALILAFYSNPSIRRVKGQWMYFAEFPDVTRRNERNHTLKTTTLLSIMVARCTNQLY